MHLLAGRFVFWGWWLRFFERVSQGLSNGTHVASWIAKHFSVFTSIVYAKSKLVGWYLGRAYCLRLFQWFWNKWIKSENWAWQVNLRFWKADISFFTHLVSRRDAVDEKPVPVDKLPERVPDRVAGPPDPDRLHHARVPQLAAAQLPVEDHRLLGLVRLDAADEERLTRRKGLHEQVEALLELGRERRGPLPRLRAHPYLLGEQVAEEPVRGHVDDLVMRTNNSTSFFTKNTSNWFRENR